MSTNPDQSSSQPNPEHTVDEFVAYLHRVGYHEVAERASRDRQIIVIRPDTQPECGWCGEPIDDPERRCEVTDKPCDPTGHFVLSPHARERLG